MEFGPFGPRLQSMKWEKRQKNLQYIAGELKKKVPVVISIWNVSIIYAFILWSCVLTSLNRIFVINVKYKMELNIYLTRFCLNVNLSATSLVADVLGFFHKLKRKI